MRGVGHFAIGFLVAYIVVLVAGRSSRALWWRLYGPFMPFALGLFATVPYLAQLAGLMSDDSPYAWLWNVFLLYGVVQHSTWLTRVFGEFHISVSLVALAYLHLLFRYVRLVKGARQAYAE